MSVVERRGTGVLSCAFGAKVAASRADAGMGRSELAARVGVRVELIALIERGRAEPSLSLLFALAHALRLEPARLLDGLPANGFTAPALPRAALTDREREVLMLLRERRSNKQIAVALGITVRTVEGHVLRVMRKMHVSQRRALFFSQ